MLQSQQGWVRPGLGPSGRGKRTAVSAARLALGLCTGSRGFNSLSHFPSVVFTVCV